MSSLRFLIIAFALTFPKQVFSQETKSIIYFENLYLIDAQTALLHGEIVPGTFNNFQKLLSERKVKTLILVSPGGLVDEALNIADEVHLNNIATFIPAKRACFSACAFVFFAGKSRLSNGALGVHQISYSPAFSRKRERVGSIASETQSVLAEITEALNRFDVPKFVYERMLSTKEMYVFTQNEIIDLNRGNIEIDQVKFDSFERELNENKSNAEDQSKRRFSLKGIRKISNCLLQIGQITVLTCLSD